MPNKFISNGVLRELLDNATDDEKLSLTKILDKHRIKAYGSIELQEKICLEGGHGISNFFRGQGTGYLDIIDDVASELNVSGLTPYYRISKFDELESLNISQDIARDKGIKYAEIAEEKVIIKLLEKIYDQLDTKQKQEFDQQVTKIAKEYGSDSTAILSGSAGLLVLGNLGGFATYTFLTSALSTLSFGSLGFASYTAATSALSVALGPVGWTVLGVTGVVVAGKPEYEKLIPIVAMIGTIRQRLKQESDNTQEVENTLDNLNNLSLDMEKDNKNEKKIHTPISFTKQIIGEIGKEVVKRTKEQKKEREQKTRDQRVMHEPLLLVKQLKNFNSDRAMKNATHISIDGKQYSEIVQKIHSRWEREKESFKDKKLKEKIDTFLYSSKNTDGWSSEKLINWCDNNPDSFLTTCPIDIETKFSDIVNDFKKEIEITPSINPFNIFLLKITDELLGVFEKKIDDASEEILEEAKFFTNTESLRLGLKLIMNEIAQRESTSNKFQIVAMKDISYFELHITHLDSYSKMDENSIRKRIDNNEGSFPIIKEELASICDLSIKTKYKEMDLAIDILGSILDKNIVYENDNLCGGFTYILRFFR